MILQHNEYCLIFIVKNKDHYISKQYGFTYRHDHGIISETESEEKEEDEEEVSLEDKDINLGQNIPTVQTNEELDNLIGDRPVLVYTCTSLLEKLARAVIHNTCKVEGCGAQIQIKLEFVSSCIFEMGMSNISIFCTEIGSKNKLFIIFYIICIVQFQTCTNNHIAHRWCSQPILNRRVHSGDVLFSAALLASGNNFQKLSLFAKFLKLPI